MKRISIKGVLIGGVIDLVSSVFFVVIYMLFYIPIAHAMHLPHGHYFHSTISRIPPLIIGFICEAFGGYISARIAKHHEILNGACASFLCVLFGIFSFLHDSSHLRFMIFLLITIATVIAAGLGG